MSIDSEEFRAALNHMVNMDDEHSALPMQYTEDRAHEAAMAFLKFVDNYCDNQSIVHKKRIDKLEEALQNILYGMEASGGWEGDDDLFSAGMNALKP